MRAGAISRVNPYSLLVCLRGWILIITRQSLMLSAGLVCAPKSIVRSSSRCYRSGIPPHKAHHPHSYLLPDVLACRNSSNRCGQAAAVKWRRSSSSTRRPACKRRRLDFRRPRRSAKRARKRRSPSNLFILPASFIIAGPSMHGRQGRLRPGPTSSHFSTPQLLQLHARTTSFITTLRP